METYTRIFLPPIVERKWVEDEDGHVFVKIIRSWKDTSDA